MEKTPVINTLVVQPRFVPSKENTMASQNGRQTTRKIGSSTSTRPKSQRRTLLQLIRGGQLAGRSGANNCCSFYNKIFRHLHFAVVLIFHSFGVYWIFPSPLYRCNGWGSGANMTRQEAYGPDLVDRTGTTKTGLGCTWRLVREKEQGLMAGKGFQSAESSDCLYMYNVR